jgi:hypothetical protein
MNIEKADEQVFILAQSQGNPEVMRFSGQSKGEMPLGPLQGDPTDFSELL